jgi:hypothetical protein
MSIYGNNYTPSFPMYVTTTGEFRDDTIAWTDGEGSIVTEDGVFLTYNNFEEFRAHMFTEQIYAEGKRSKALLMLYDGEFEDMDIYEEIVENCEQLLDRDPESGIPFKDIELRKGASTIFANTKTLKMQYIKFHRPGGAATKGARMTHLIQAETWALQNKEPEFMFENLRRTFDYFGYGTSASQIALGMTILRQCWYELYGKDWWFQRVKGVPNGIAYAMRQHPIPPYVVTHGQGSVFEKGYSLDIKGAFPSAMGDNRGMPDGPSFHLRAHHEPYSIENLQSRNFLHWIGMHRCEIVSPLPVGLFPIKVKDGPNIKSTLSRGKGNDWHWPTSPGVYESWMSNEMAEVCAKYGVQVGLLWGWGWKKSRIDYALFIEKMQRFRDEAPIPYIEARAKDIVNKVIGGLAMEPTMRFQVR